MIGPLVCSLSTQLISLKSVKSATVREILANLAAVQDVRLSCDEFNSDKLRKNNSDTSALALCG